MYQQQQPIIAHNATSVVMGSDVGVHQSPYSLSTPGSEVGVLSTRYRSSTPPELPLQNTFPENIELPNTCSNPRAENKAKDNRIIINLSYESNVFFKNILNTWCKSMTKRGIAEILAPHFSRTNLAAIENFNSNSSQRTGGF